MKRKIYYIDTNSYGNFHEMFNAASLKSFSLLCDSIKYYSHLSSKICVDKVLDSPLKNLSYHRVRFPAESSAFIYLFKLILTTLYNVLFVVFSSRNAILVYNFNNLLSLHPVNFFNKIFKKKIIVICHGELDCLNNDESGGFTKKQITKYFLNNHVRISDNIYYLVLGDSILENIKSVLDDRKSKHFVSIDHPYIFKNVVYQNNFRNDFKVRIGTIGVMAYKKGLNDLLFLDKQMFSFPSIILSITGRIIDGLDLLASSKIDYPNKKGESLSRNVIERRLSDLDYVLFLYPTNSYRFISSGAILDAINSEKPIISFSNSYFRYICNKFGPFGYLVESKQEMIELFSMIENGDLYENFNFNAIKKALSPESISHSILNIIHILE